ncbi:transposase [Paraburkholderia sp. UCT70]|uniref:hypothetical protein n=1 Tax=Paraburkholderia sp. UCT70 TaxID=2991068 RepID=UPI003D22E214
MDVVKEACVEAASSDDNALLRKAYACAQWRILPTLFALWMLAWVGRSNVSFAKLQMVVDLRFSEFGGYREIGRAVAGACALGALGNVLICSIGGSVHRRRLFCALASVFTAVSLSALVFVWHSNTTATFFLLVLGFAGTGAGITLFWQMSMGLLSAKSLVVGVPLISSVANVAGFVTPFLIGYVRDATGTYASGFIMIASIQALGVLVLLFGVQRILRRTSPVDDVLVRCPT